MATYAKGNKFITKFMVAGKRVVRMHDTKAEGEAWELEGRAALKRGKPVPAPTGKTDTPMAGRDMQTLGGALRIAETLHWGPKRGSAGQVRNAQTFVNWCGPNTSTVAAFSQDNINKFQLHLMNDRHLSSGTMNRYKAALSVLARKGGAKLPEWERQFEGEGRDRYFTDAEEALVIQTWTLWGKIVERDFFIFLIGTGARPYAEGTEVLWSDVAKDRLSLRGAYNERANSRLTKTGDKRFVPLQGEARAAVERQRKRNATGPFTDLTQGDLRELWDRTRATHPSLADAVLYCTRHTYASRLVQDGVSLDIVQKLLGHKNAKMTMRYAHFAPKNLLDDVIKVMEKREHKRQFQVIDGGLIAGDIGDKAGDKVAPNR